MTGVLGAFSHWTSLLGEWKPYFMLFFPIELG